MLVLITQHSKVSETNMVVSSYSLIPCPSMSRGAYGLGWMDFDAIEDSNSNLTQSNTCWLGSIRVNVHVT